MINRLQTYSRDLLHLVFPHYCEGCGSDVIEDDQLLCLQCITRLPQTGFFAVPGNPIEKTFYGRMRVAAAGAAFYFTKHSLVQHLVTELKYHGNRGIGSYLGRLTGHQLVQGGRFNSVDAVVPLPLNRKRLEKRGYNQAALIAEGIGEAMGIPVLADAVERRLFTETQTRKDRLSRWQSMQDVFAVTGSSSLEGKHVLLVDDVVTTGATLEACGAALLKVSGITLSIATVAWTI